MKVAGNSQLRNYVENSIKEDWSPEEIAGRLREIDKDIKYASKEAIYKFIHSVYGRQLEKHLRYQRKKRKQGRPKVGQLENRSFIEERPEIVGKKLLKQVNPLFWRSNLDIQD